MEKYFQKNEQLWLVLLCVTVFFLAFYSPIDVFKSGDSRGSLLTSQAMIKQGTIKLDHYYDQIKDNLNYQYIEKNGHFYYRFPLGTSFFAVPFVWLSHFHGKDMAVLKHEMDLQNLLAALTVVLAFLLVYLICRCYLDFSGSFLFAVAFVLGAPLISTMGVALWNLNLTLVFNLLSLLLLVRERCGKSEGLNAYLLAFFLFSAYICRPTASVFILVVFIYVFIWKREAFWKLVLTSFGLLVFFSLFSLVELKQLLPDYYMPGRLTTETFWTALFGNLVSPVRGVLVYSPYLFLTLGGVILFFKKLRRKPFFIMMSVWFLLHLVVISNFPHWWAGACFGARFFTDGFPALMLLTLVVFGEGFLQLTGKKKKASLIAFGALALVAVFFNTYQGVYNPFITSMGYDEHQDYLFNWNFPYFMCSPDLVEKWEYEIQLKHTLKRMTPYAPGNEIEPFSENAVYKHWLKWPEGAKQPFKVARGNFARIIFRVLPPNLDSKRTYALNVEAWIAKGAIVSVVFNDYVVGSMEADGSENDGQSASYRFELEGKYLREVNGVKFSITGGPAKKQGPRLRWYRLVIE